MGGCAGEVYDNYLYENGKLKSFDVFRVFVENSTLFIGKFLFEYNSSGLLISSESYSHNDKTIYKYDEKGNRIESYGYLKLRQKFNAKGQVTEEWAFDDKDQGVRYSAIKDAQGNSLPDEIKVIPPQELPPKIYEYNEFGDVTSITDVRNPQAIADTITLTYDSIGNWIDRKANGEAMFNHYQTTEQIYTNYYLSGLDHIRRTIEYYQ